jgi:ribosomal protein S18 acetylase RimI-like enzyme
MVFNTIRSEGMSEILVRQAVLADLDALASLFDGYRQFYGQSSDVAAARAFLQARFEHAQSTIFLAESEGQAVGFTQLYPSFSSVSMARVLVLNDLYVVPRARRLRVGQSLLNAAAAHAKQLGAIRLSLSTAVDNTSAQALYESQGWGRDQKFLAYHLALK